MPSFEIPDSPAEIALKPQPEKNETVYAGAASFSVTNKSGRPLAGRMSVEVQGGAKAEWFQIAGEKERSFATAETQKIAVNIKTAPKTATGEYKFRLRIVNVNDPDNDYTDSAVVTFKVADVPVKKAAFPIWAIIAAAAVLVLVVGGVVAWLVIPGGGKVAVPDVSTAGLTYDNASAQITSAGLTPAKNPTPAQSGTPGTVVDQDPKAGTEVDKNRTVTLTVAEAPPVQTVEVPDVRGKSFDAAQQQLIDGGFKVAAPPQRGTPTGAAPNTVIAQNPGQGTRAETGATIALTIDPGVTVPNVIGQRPENLGNRLADFSVTIAIRREVGTVGEITATNPMASQVVAKNAPLTVTVRAAPCTGRFCVRPGVMTLDRFMLDRSRIIAPNP